MMILAILIGALLSVVLLMAAIREFLAVGAARRRAVSGAEGFGGDDRPATVLQDADQQLRHTRLGRWLEDELDLAGIDRSPLLVVVSGSAVALVATYVLWTFFAPLLAVFGLLAGVAAVRWYLRRGQLRRREAFVAQLPELARVLANASFAGLSLPTAIGIAGDELSEPAHTELTRVATRLKFGAPLSSALAGLQARVGTRETSVLISTLVVASRSGGSMVKALRTIADTLEQRKETRREVQTTLAQSVATAYMIAGVGVVSLLLINAFKPGTVQQMTTTPIGQAALIVSAVLFVIGFVAIRRMTRISA